MWDGDEDEREDENSEYDQDKVARKDEDEEEASERQRPPGRVWHCRHSPPRQSPPLLGARAANPPTLPDSNIHSLVLVAP